MKEEKLIKKVKDQANKFKLRTLKSPEDEKRHDQVRRDERKSMWIAHNRLGWSFAKIGSVFGRDPRTTKQAVESYKAIKQAAKQQPYDETPHKQKMREIAGQVAGAITSPSVFDSFTVGLKLGKLIVGRDGLSIVVSKMGQVKAGLELVGHLYEGLVSHLKTGGYSNVLDEIEAWRVQVADNLVQCHKLFTVVKEEVEKSYNITVPLDYQGQPGFTPWFLITVCGGAIEQARGVTYITDSWYSYEGSDLRCGAFLIYKGVAGEDLAVYRNVHIELRAKYAGTDKAKKIAEQRNGLYRIEDKIGKQLLKFADVEHLRGQCELCSLSSL